MALTSLLGAADSTLGNIALGLGAIMHAEYIVSAENSLFFDNDGRNPEKNAQADQDQLQFQQSVTTNLKTAIVSDSLTFTQTLVVAGPIHVGVVNSLLALEPGQQPGDVGFKNEASVQSSRQVSADSMLSFATTVSSYLVRADAIECVAENSLTFTNDAKVVLTGAAENSVTFDHAVSATVGKGLLNTVVFSNTASATSSDTRPASNSVSFDQSVAYTLVRPNTLCEYSPFGLRPLRGHTSETFQLVFPPAGPYTDTLALKNPNFGNRERLGITRIQRETRGGTLDVYTDPIWPKTTTLVLQFSDLKRTEANALKTFHLSHLGQEVGLMDWEGVYWVGVIVEFDPIVTDRPGNYTAGFQFEAVESDWTHGLDQPLEFAQLASAVVE